MLDNGLDSRGSMKLLKFSFLFISIIINHKISINLGVLPHDVPVGIVFILIKNQYILLISSTTPLKNAIYSDYDCMACYSLKLDSFLEFSYVT